MITCAFDFDTTSNNGPCTTSMLDVGTVAFPPSLFTGLTVTCESLVFRELTTPLTDESQFTIGGATFTVGSPSPPCSFPLMWTQGSVGTLPRTALADFHLTNNNDILVPITIGWLPVTADCMPTNTSICTANGQLAPTDGAPDSELDCIDP